METPALIFLPSAIGIALLIPCIMYVLYKAFSDDDYKADSDPFVWVVIYLLFGFVTIPLTIIVGIPYLLSQITKKD